MIFGLDRLVRGRSTGSLIAALFLGFLSPSCSDTSGHGVLNIELEPVALLRGTENGNDLSPSSRIYRDSSGHLFAAPLMNPGTIAVFDKAGRLERLIGHPGRGPGEIQHIHCLVVGREDTLHVFDWMLNRWSRFTSEGAFCFSTNMPGRVHQAAMTQTGDMILHMHIGNASQDMRPFHLVETDGKIVRSFGPEMPDFSNRDLDLFLWNIGPAPGGGFWAAPLNRYDIELWNLDGERARTLQRSAEWFVPWDEVDRAEPFEAEPHPRIGGLQEDDAGRLWVLIVVAAEDWEALDMDTIGELNQMGVLSTVYDWVIEVLDQRDASVIARTVFDGPVQLIGDGLIAVPREQSDGRIEIDVCRTAFVRQDNGYGQSMD